MDVRAGLVVIRASSLLGLDNGIGIASKEVVQDKAPTVIQQWPVQKFTPPLSREAILGSGSMYVNCS
jgi:hypothetical protein